MLREWKIRLDPPFVGLVDDRGLGQVALAFGVLGGEKVPTLGMRAQDLTGPGYLESFRDGFSRLAARNRLRHKARKIIASADLTTRFLFTGDRIGNIVCRWRILIARCRGS